MTEPEGKEAVGEGDGEGVGGGFGGRLASTAAVLAMRNATARTAATWTLRCRDLITLRIGRLPTCFESGLLRRATSRGSRPVSGVDATTSAPRRLERHFRFFSGKAHPIWPARPYGQSSHRLDHSREERRP
jgi:hypothetical protein